MNQTDNSNSWDKVNGGLRGSTLLCSGAITMVLATWQNFTAKSISLDNGQVPELLITSAWLCWIVALWLLAAGFLWIGTQPFLSRMGLVVGIFHLVSGIYLLIILFGGTDLRLPGVSLSIGRTLLVIVFAFVERKHLHPINFNALVAVALLQYMKIGFRLIGILPSMGPMANGGLDSLLLTLLAVAIFLVGRDIRMVENQWAMMQTVAPVCGLGDFNNPEHEWNKDQG